MVFESNELDMLILQDGKDGVAKDSKYTWVKYSAYADGTDLTDDPTNAVYMGTSFNQTEQTESENPSDYTWVRILGNDGEKGEAAYTIILENENITFSTDKDGLPVANQTKTCDVLVMKGTKNITDFTISNISAPSGITTSVSNNTIKISTDTSTAIAEDYGDIQITIVVNEITFTKSISYNLLKLEAGVSVTNVDVYYCISDSSSSITDESWDTEAPVWENGKYIWSKTVTTLDNGKVIESNPVCLTGEKGNDGEPGDVGATGTGIESITEEYYLSTSKESPTGGTWDSTQPVWENGKYIWTRIKIIYKNPTSTEYTEPYCDTSWEAANDVRDELIKEIETVTSTISGVESKVDNNTKSITDKVWQDDITEAINNYNETTTTELRNRVTSTETDITGIKSTVSDVQSTLKGKADGTTVESLTERVTKAEQDAESFKQTAEETYVTKDELGTESKTLRSEFTQTANEIKQEVSNNTGNISTLKTDIEGVKGRVEDAEGNISSLQETAKEITLSVSKKQDSTGTAIRYIRDWLNGNNVDSDNRWVECKVMCSVKDDEVDSEGNELSGYRNVAEGIIATCKDSDLNDVTISSAEIYTNGILLAEDSTSYYVTSSGNVCLQLDLGEVHYDVDYIQIWHYYLDNRVYNHKLQVSSDGISWITLYDSSVSGGYEENKDGHVHYVSQGSIQTELAKLSIASDEIRASVEKNNGQISEILQNYESISQMVATDRTYAKSVEKKVDDLTKLHDEKVAADAKQFAEFITSLNGISSRVTLTEDEITRLTNITQDADGWKALFAQLNMYDDPTVQTNVTIDINGITVENPKTHEKTMMRIDGFSGWDGDNKVFWIEEGTAKTTKLYCQNGWDTGIIKMVTNIFTLADGTTLSGASFVKSKGLIYE